MVEVVKVLFPSDSEADRAGRKVERVPLANDTCTRRVIDLSAHLSPVVDMGVEHAQSVLIALDESTDIMDTAMLAIFVRYCDSTSLQEGFLDMTPMLGTTKGSDFSMPSRNISRSTAYH